MDLKILIEYPYESLVAVVRLRTRTDTDAKGNVKV